MRGGGLVHRLRLKKPAHLSRAFGFVAVVKLPVGDVVQQRCKLDHRAVRAFGLGEADGHLPHAMDVPPVVAGAVARKLRFDVGAGVFYQGLG